MVNLSKYSRGALASSIAALALAGAAHAATYDALADFSSTTNTAANTWSYWTSASTAVSTYPGAISLAPVYFSDCGFGTTCWDSTSGLNNLLLANKTGVNGPFPNGIARDNQLSFYTRSGLVLLRFLAPSAGTYAVKGFFEGSAANPEQTQEFIAVNDNVSSPVLDITSVVPFGGTNSFNFNTTLAAGGTIDFLVAGISTTADLNSLDTGFDATITSATTGVPEPAAWIMLLAGFWGIGAAVRSKVARAAKARAYPR